MSLWLSAANSWAGAMRGLWTAELHRQQTAMANEMIRQTIDFWTRTGISFAPTVRSRLMIMQTAGADGGTDEVGPVRVEPLLQHQLSQSTVAPDAEPNDDQLDT
jgi:hypothetical protein